MRSVLVGSQTHLRVRPQAACAYTSACAAVHRRNSNNYGGWALVPLVLLFAGAASLAGQEVRGVVRDAETTLPIPTATVMLMSDSAGGSAAVTDSTGAFLVRLPAPGAYRLTIEHIGYSTLTQEIDVAPYQEVLLTAKLSRSAIVLDPIEVVARRRTELFGVGGYYDRLDLYGRMGIGRFVTREDMKFIGNPTDYLRNVPFVHLRGGSAVSRIPLFRRHGRYCVPRIYFDGMMVRAADLDDMYGTVLLEGIEVYRGVAHSPGLYWDPAGCGVILYWSRRDPYSNTISARRTKPAGNETK